MTKYLLAAVVLLSVATATTANLWLKTRDRMALERHRAEQLDGQLTALRERADRAAKARVEGEQLRVEVRRESNATEWGAGAVPSGVASRLCQRAVCASRDAVPPPSD